MNVVVIPAIHQIEDGNDRNAGSDHQLNQELGDFQRVDAAVFDFPRNKNAILVLFANDFCHLVREPGMIKEGGSLIDVAGPQADFEFQIHSLIAQRLIVLEVNQRLQLVPVGDAIIGIAMQQTGHFISDTTGPHWPCTGTSF